MLPGCAGADVVAMVIFGKRRFFFSVKGEVKH